jgi:hypothetical protein
LALSDQLQEGVGEDGLGRGSGVEDGIDRQRIALRVADAVGADMGDLAMIDDREGHAFGLGAGSSVFVGKFGRASLHEESPLRQSSRTAIDTVLNWM